MLFSQKFEVLMRILNLILLIYISQMLSSCVPALFVASASTTMASAKDRSFGDTVDDITIATKIRKGFASNGFKKLYTKIGIEVVQGRVLLTGSVESEGDIIKAVEISWSIFGVREVINEIKIVNDDKFRPGQYAKDTWITSRISTSLFFRRDIKFANYTVITNDNVVYLFGIARTEEELQKVTKIASEVSGVKKVVSHVHLREEPARKIQRPEDLLKKDDDIDDDFNEDSDKPEGDKEEIIDDGFKY